LLAAGGKKLLGQPYSPVELRYYLLAKYEQVRGETRIAKSKHPGRLGGKVVG
jgi:hypothetical protein